jgi:hypothetical protein
MAGEGFALREKKPQLFAGGPRLFHTRTCDPDQLGYLPITNVAPSAPMM